MQSCSEQASHESIMSHPNVAYVLSTICSSLQVLHDACTSPADTASQYPISHWPGPSWAVQVCGCTVSTDSVRSTHLVAWQHAQVSPTQCNRSALLGGPCNERAYWTSLQICWWHADAKWTCLLTENLQRLVFLKANLMWNSVNVNDESRWWMMDGKDNNDDELQLWWWMIMKSLQSLKQLFVFYSYSAE